MFSIKSRRMVAAALSCALGFGGVASAEEGRRSPFELPPAPYRWAPPAPAPAPAPAAPAAMTTADLGAALRLLGYDPEVATEAGATEYAVSVSRPRATVRAAVFVAAGRQLVCFGSRLPARIDPRTPAGAARLVRLMERNTEIAPAMFALDKKDGRLWLLMQLPNYDVTPARLNDAVQRFATAVEETASLWGEADDRAAQADGR